MFQPDEHGVYARVQASQARRILAYGVLFALGVLLIYLPLARPPDLVWTIFMLALGFYILWIAERLRRATLGAIELTDTDIRTHDGQVLAEMNEIAEVDRGVFAIKPSNGFTLILANKKPRGWAPGLWWRIGRRVGVGGVTSAGQAKFMAEQIAFRLQQRQD